MGQRAVATGAVAAVVVGMGIAQLLPGNAPVARADGLVGYASCDELLDHYRAELERSFAVGYGWGGGPVVAEDDAAGAARSSAESAPSAVGSGPTGTNLQEQGVDEPDLAKLRDGRLVVLTGDRLRVLSAAAQPRLLGSLDLGAQGTYGGELLLVGERALVVLSGWRETPQPDSASGGSADRMMYVPGTPTTRVALVDLAGDDPWMIEDATYDGSYVSARLVEGTVRLVTSAYPRITQAYPTEPGVEGEVRRDNEAAARNATLAEVLPQVVRRDAGGQVLERGPAVACEQTAYAPRSRGASTLLVTTLRPEDGLAATDRDAVTTDGDLVYASTDRLYVATSRWGTVAPMGDAVSRLLPDFLEDEVRTQLHAFEASGTSTTYLGSGNVPGYVLGRWALSEHEDVLRVATTRQPPWDSERETSSMVVKLAEEGGRLVETGRVEGLGRTEQIRAVRYFGDLAAVVTFRQTDPLYLIDLGGSPRVLGELKIPGFSTYLHPLGDGLLLGIGQDATLEGQITGMAVSVFDISDPTSPRQVDRLRLGQGWSPALDDSRAFSYDPARRLAAFAFTAYDPAAVSETSGAIGIAVSESGTLREVGRLGAAGNPATGGGYASRVLLGPDTAFAVSDAGVVAADPATMAHTGAVTWPSAGGGVGISVPAE